MGYILSLQTLERSEDDGGSWIAASTLSIGICRSTVSTTC